MEKQYTNEKLEKELIGLAKDYITANQKIEIISKSYNSDQIPLEDWINNQIIQKSIDSRNNAIIEMSKKFNENKIYKNPYFLKKYELNELNDKNSLEDYKNNCDKLISSLIDKTAEEMQIKAFDNSQNPQEKEFQKFIEDNIKLSNKIIEFEKKENIYLPQAKTRIFKEIANDISKLDNTFAKNHIYFSTKCDLGKVSKPKEIIAKFVHKNKEKVHSQTKWGG